MHPIQTQFRRKKTSHIRKGFATFPRLVSLLVRQEDRLNMGKTHSWNSSLAQRREGNYSREGNSFRVILWDVDAVGDGLLLEEFQEPNGSSCGTVASPGMTGIGSV